MKKNINLIQPAYTAPELEVAAVVAENGFGVSAAIADAPVNDYEEEF